MKRSGVDCVCPLYLINPEVIGYIEEYEGRKYLNFASIEVNSDVLSKYASVWNGILEQIGKINGFGRDYGKIKVGTVGSNDNTDLSLNKLIKFSAMTISCRLLIEKDDKYYPEVYLEECLYDDYWFNV